MSRGSRGFTIRIDDLPPRPSKLTAEQTSRIFGGCLDYDEVCAFKSDCCDNRECRLGNDFKSHCRY